MAEQVDEPVAAEEPAAEEPAAEEPAAEEPAAEEQAAEEPAAEEPEEEPAAEEEPKSEEPKTEEPASEEPKAEPKAEPEEETKEEPKPAKKKSKKKKRKRAPSGDGSNPEAEKAWGKICKKSSEINWFMLKLKGKPGKSTSLEFVQEGTGGAKEVVEFLSSQSGEILFGLLRCVTTDDSKSVRNKFIFLRFIGSTVKTMVKAKMTPSLGKIGAAFPVKHMTLDINEQCEADLEPVKLTKELLRIGGAHAPDAMSFGPNQDVLVKDLE